MYVVREQKILNIFVTDWKGRVHGNEWYAISFVVVPKILQQALFP